MPVDRAGSTELYYRPDDPREQRNVVADLPDVADRLELKLRRQIASL